MKVSSRGGGITFGRSKIKDAIGKFTVVTARALAPSLWSGGLQPAEALAKNFPSASAG